MKQTLKCSATTTKDKFGENQGDEIQGEKNLLTKLILTWVPFMLWS